ncbi:MAG: hypothetical protein ACO2Y9_10465 [Pseudohongiellaceae bacterium]
MNKPTIQHATYIAVFILIAFLSNPVMASEAEAVSAEAKEVKVHVELLDLTKIDSVEQRFDASLYVELTWKSPSTQSAEVTPGIVDLDEIWHPNIQVLNAQRLVPTLPRKAMISPNGGVLYRQRFLGTFTQPLDLTDYPFDSQVIELKLVAAGHSVHQLKFVVEHDSGAVSQLSVPNWALVDSSVRSEEMAIGLAGIEVESVILALRLERNRGFFIIKILLPLTLIVLMSFTVFWLNPANAGPQVSVSATAMLTLIAFRFSMSSMLPPISLLTRLDWFVLFSTLLVFFSLLEVIYTTGLAHEGELERSKRVDKVCRWIFPSLFLASVVYSFVLRCSFQDAGLLHRFRNTTKVYLSSISVPGRFLR